MATQAVDSMQIQAFREAFERQIESDSRFASPERRDRPDGSTLATRWPSAANGRVWFEMAIRPLIPQIRVGILTDDRWKSEDFEEKIEESGDSMSEFVGLGFEEAGLPWPEPPVEHYREELKYFYFATGFEPVTGFSDPSTLDKARRMLEGYHHAFGPFLA